MKALCSGLLLLMLVTVTPAHAWPGYALSFDGTTNGWVDMGAAVIPTSGDFTVACWAYCSVSNALTCREILSQGSSGNAFYIGTEPGNNTFRLGDTWVSTDIPYPFHGWHHFALVKSANTIFYIDGASRATNATPIANPSASTGLRLARQYGDYGEYWPGLIDEVQIWSRALSPSEIQTSMTQEPDVGDSDLVAYWPFREAPGILRTADASGHGHTGVLINRPMRVLRGWPPMLLLNGTSPLTNECHASFTDPGAVASGSPAAIAVGSDHSLALKADGTVVGWGTDYYGETNGATASTNIIAIGAGNRYSLALKADGTVTAWGNNNDGQINVPASATNVVAVAAGAYHGLALRADGTVVGWGRNNYGQANGATAGGDVVAVSAGDQVSLALKADGTVVAWGEGSVTNVPASCTNIVAVSAGSMHCLALKADGTVVGWGNNSFGCANGASAGDHVVAIVAFYQNSMALKDDGSVVAWGEGIMGGSQLPASATNVVAIAARDYHGMALRADGSLVAWGQAGSGQLNIPANLDGLDFPVAVSGTVDTNTPGVYLLTYCATNQNGFVIVTNRNVVVADTTAPAIALLGDNPMVLAVGTPFVDPGATASDACGGNLTASIVVTGAVNANVIGSYTRTYTVADAASNSVSTGRTVLVCGQPSISGLSAVLAATNTVAGTYQAQFDALVNPNGLDTVAFFQYGLNTAYAGAHSTNLPAGFADGNFAASLALAAGYTYHWRMVASNSLGVTASGDQVLDAPAVYARGDFDGDGVVDQGELNDVYDGYWQDNPTVITNALGLGNTDVQLKVENTIGWDVGVQASTNMADWTNLPARAVPVFQFSDPDATNFPTRVYRLLAP